MTLRPFGTCETSLSRPCRDLFFMMRLSFSLVLTSLSVALAFPGIYRQKAPQVSTLAHSDSLLDNLDLSNTERQALFSISETSGNSDTGQKCYSLIYDQVKQGCARDSDMEPGDRMLASVLLTLCDLRASNQSVPLECRSAQSSSGTTLPGDASLGSCVEALSRSTRHWSSYAGYLREIPQMCFALQRWRDTDRARELYKAATREKIALVQMWNRKVGEAAEANNVERDDRQRWFQELSRFATQARLDLQSFLNELTATLATLDKLNGHETGLIESMKGIEPRLMEVGLSMMREWASANQQHAQELSQQLQQATDRHSDLLEHAIAEHLSKASEAIELGLTAPLASAQHLAADLHTHTDVLQLTLREQHGLVDTLASASEAMVARQELHGQRLNQELNAMYQMKLGLESVGRELNQTNTQLGLLLRSHSSSASFLYNALFVVERMVLWAAGEVEGRFGLGSLNFSGLGWMLLFWPISLKLRAIVMAIVPVLKSLLAGLVLLVMLLRGLLKPCYLIWLGLFPNRSATLRKGAEKADEVRIDLEPQLSASLCVVAPRNRAEIASRSIQPYELRDKYESVRRTRVHCPSAQ